MNLCDVPVNEPSFVGSDAGGASTVEPQAPRRFLLGHSPTYIRLSQLSTDLNCCDVGRGKCLLDFVTDGKSKMKVC